MAEPQAAWPTLMGPLPDELLSSWLARLAMAFYKVDYDPPIAS